MPCGAHAFFTGGPGFRAATVGFGIRQLQGGAAAIGQLRPASAIQPGHFINQGTGVIPQPQALSAIGQGAAELALGNHEVATCGQEAGGGKGVVDGIAETPASEIDELGCRVVEFDPFRRVFGIGNAGSRIWIGGPGVIGDFVDHDGAGKGGERGGSHGGSAVDQGSCQVQDDIGRTSCQGYFQGDQISTRDEGTGVNGQPGGGSCGRTGGARTIEITLYGSFQNAGEEKAGMGHFAAPGEGFPEIVSGVSRGQNGQGCGRRDWAGGA